MAWAPYSGSTSTTPPPKKNPPTPSYQDALNEHIAVQTGQTPVQVANNPGVPAYTEPAYTSPQLTSQTYWNPNAVQMWAPLINQYLERYNSPLAGLGKKFVKKGNKYGIDPRLLVAITGAESSFGKNEYGSHNPFGMGPGIDYPSYGAAIDATAKNLNENYFGQGLNTIEEISGKYAPPGAANDKAHNLNPNWAGNVRGFYKELTKMRPTPPKLKGLAELFYQGRLWNANSGYFSDSNLSAAHMTHIHEAATNPHVLLKSLRVGQNRFGLTAGENPYTGKVYPVHAGTSAQYGDTSGSGNPSYHYRTFPGTFGPDKRPLGEAIDWTGAAEDLARFNEWLTNRFVGKGAYDYGTRGVAGGGTPATAPGVPGGAAREQGAQDAALNTGATIFDASFSGSTRARRKRKDKQVIEQLLNNLGYGGTV